MRIAKIWIFQILALAILNLNYRCTPSNYSEEVNDGKNDVLEKHFRVYQLFDSIKAQMRSSSIAKWDEIDIRDARGFISLRYLKNDTLLMEEEYSKDDTSLISRSIFSRNGLFKLWNEYTPDDVLGYTGLYYKEKKYGPIFYQSRDIDTAVSSYMYFKGEKFGLFVGDTSEMDYVVRLIEGKDDYYDSLILMFTSFRELAY